MKQKLIGRTALNLADTQKMAMIRSSERAVQRLLSIPRPTLPPEGAHPYELYRCLKAFNERERRTRPILPLVLGSQQSRNMKRKARQTKVANAAFDIAKSCRCNVVDVYRLLRRLLSEYL